MLKPPASFIRALLTLALSICSATVWAAPEPEEVEPRYYTKLLSLGGPPYPIFDTPYAAWAYYKPIRQAQMIKNYGPNGHPPILQDLYETPASEQGAKGNVTTINGKPVIHSYTALVWKGTPNGDAYVPGTGPFESLQAECPQGTTPNNTGSSYETYQYVLSCRPPQIPHPDSCPHPTVKVGNPIYPGSGRKQQTEPDYRSPSGTGLSFSRIYRSDANGWTHSHAYAGVDLNAPAQLYPNHP
ncbi:MAG: hypothetical protein K1X48_07995, partial [Burkholderiaceae bacterium]|nr:hypothetical protein [Burkholderiaceae bacterium]